MKEKTIDFGTTKVSRLFRQLFFPTLLGMLSLSAVTTIDGIFIGHGVGSNGIAAVNICIPLLMIITGVGLMIGVGCSVVTSIYLSKKKQIAARASFTQAMLAVTIFIILVTAFIFAFPQKAAYILGASNNLLPMVVDYLIWFSPSLIFDLWIVVAMFALRLDGAPKLAMWCSIISAFVNVVLDWLFIFPFNWGVMGAALATSISCAVGAGIAIVYLLFYARSLRLQSIHFGKRSLHFFFKDIAHQCKLGSPALLGEATMAVLMFVGNHTFMRYLGDDGVGAFGVSCYYLPFVFMIGNSIAQSSQPIISYNHGINNTERVKAALHVSLMTSFICSTVSTLAFMLFPELLVGLFLNLDNAAAQIALNGFPYYGSGFIFFVINLCIIGYYQSIENVKCSTFFALLRGFILLIPCFIILPQIKGNTGIWLALPLSELLTTTCIVIYYLRNRKMTKKLWFSRSK